MNWKTRLTLVLALTIVSPIAQAVDFAIVGAKVFDAIGTAPYDATVVIEDGLIASIDRAGAVPLDMPILEAEGLALLPGFYDLHVHFTPLGQPATAPQILAAYVASGVTTVFNFHSAPEAFTPQRDWFAELPGPRVKFVARMSTPGGHGAEWGDETTTRWVNTPHAATANVEDLATRYQPDAIKAFADGWRYGSGVDTSSMDEPTLAALVAEAHEQGVPVLTHTVTAERAAIAGRAGVDVIAHSTLDRDLEDRELSAVLEGGSSYAGTLAVYDPDKPGRTMTEEREKRLRAMFGIGLRNMKALHGAGVPVVLGTDAGMPGTPHGVSTVREMELMVSAGLTATEALVAGTANSARAAGEIDSRGTIEVGKAADLVLVAGEPWNDISAARNAVYTFVGGELMFGDGAPEPVTASHMEPAPITDPVIDDFDRDDGRTSRDTLRVGDSDMGKERSRQLFQTRFESEERGRVLHLSGELAEREDPHIGVVMPLFRGSVRAADVSRWQGVKADLRGRQGPAELVLATRRGSWKKELAVTSDWTTVSVAFEEFVPNRAGLFWSGNDLVQVRLLVRGEGGQKVWLEVDQVRFF